LPSHLTIKSLHNCKPRRLVGRAPRPRAIQSRFRSWRSAWPSYARRRRPTPRPLEREPSPRCAGGTDLSGVGYARGAPHTPPPWMTHPLWAGVCCAAEEDQSRGPESHPRRPNRWHRAGAWSRIKDALARIHDAAVQMIDTSIVRVHQHAGSCCRTWCGGSVSLMGCHNRNNRSALPCAMRALSAALTGICSKKARAWDMD
jgi:hypothetical protein